MNNSLQLQNFIIEQQKQLVDNLTQQLNCTSNQGYSMINGSCVQVTCAISGQQSINGICQCVNINSVVLSGSCVCPVNSQIIGTACVCTFSGQTMQNGVCSCSTTGAFVDNGVCTCGVNGINISNTCSCPIGANLLNGVCTCTNINAYISGNQCICPTYSSLIGSTCTCPTNSQIENNQCVCNLISGQILNNDGICQCQTIGAFVKNGACVCELNALNVSNTCTCPVNSSLINYVCTCDQILGQQIIAGSCQCPSGQSIVNNTCYQSNHILNFTYFECSQEIFTQQFDIQSITNQISSPSNFSAGYVFSSTNIIQNAFIDISDNLYSSTTYPLFQSQNKFMNLKIQFGTQILSSGSIILSSSIQSIQINQINFISKHGSQLTVNVAQQLSILMQSSTNVNIQNLLVNLTFAPSNGNISLISCIKGVSNISGYQILGNYVSTQTVAMIGLNIDTATIIVNQVCFKPQQYNVGNGSSFLFGNAIATISTIQIYNFAVILGNSTNFLLLGTISTSSQNSDYYMFGGIIAYVNSNSIVNVYNVILDSFQKFTSIYVSYSGILVGYMQQVSSSVSLENVCLQQNITSTTLLFQFYGLIGFNFGNSSITNASIIFSLQASQFWCLGIIGIIHHSLNAEVINLKTSVHFSSNSGNFVGAIIGADQAQNCSVENTIIIGNINSGSICVGGISGSLYIYSNMTVQNSSISQFSINGSTMIGGFIGHCYSTLYLINSKIYFISLSGSNQIGIIVGQSDEGVYLFSGSSSSSNHINNILQSDCGVLSNNWSIIGC
ncbi:Conserved_hypothetical protein [Hexamita inflata]|uniref:Uncharacterized protein n=1 Tax=Hexamita inflata TaxID=28002 RepID=A0AA86U5B9_9EUKA|nr:Conserved hypothetical protein [Hexamita inflata]